MIVYLVNQPVCTYVGDEGIAEIRLVGFPILFPRKSVLLFENADVFFYENHDNKIGIRKQIPTGDSLLDKYFSVYSNDKDKIFKILNYETKSDLLKWAQKKPINRISDIRNYDDKIIFCVYGELKDRYEFEQLVKSAIDFYDSHKEVLLNISKIAN